MAVKFPDRSRYFIRLTDEIHDIILKLLRKDKETRLGYKADFEEILAHLWFADIDIDSLVKKTL